MQIDLYSQSGEKTEKLKLNSYIFEVEINKGLIHLAYVNQMANARQATAKTKTRGEVRGGGKKPWKQKGTGRARTGSLRSPVFIGGGTIFGPTGTQNYKKDMPRKQREKALFSTLSLKAKENTIIAVEEFKTTVIKTKEAITLIAKLPIARTALLVIPDNNESVKRAFRNIPFIRVIQAPYLNIRDLLTYEMVIFAKSSLEVVEKLWANDAKQMFKGKVDKVETKVVTTKPEAKKEGGKEVVVKKVVAVKKAPVKKEVAVKKTIVKKVAPKKAPAKKNTSNK